MGYPPVHPLSKFKDSCGMQDKIRQTMEISKVRPDIFGSDDKQIIS